MLAPGVKATLESPLVSVSAPSVSLVASELLPRNWSVPPASPIGATSAIRLVLLLPAGPELSIRSIPPVSIAIPLAAVRLLKAAVGPLRTSVPPAIVTAAFPAPAESPELVLFAVRESVPSPVSVNEPVPVNGPANVVVWAALGMIRVLALVRVAVPVNVRGLLPNGAVGGPPKVNVPVFR